MLSYTPDYLKRQVKEEKKNECVADCCFFELLLVRFGLGSLLFLQDFSNKSLFVLKIVYAFVLLLQFVRCNCLLSVERILTSLRNT